MRCRHCILGVLYSASSKLKPQNLRQSSVYSVHCAIGWVDFYLFNIFNESQVEKCCILAQIRKMAKQVFSSIDLVLIAPDFVSHSLYKGQQNFVTMWTFWVSKYTEFYVELKNINFP
jgi:hypothetical protein